MKPVFSKSTSAVSLAPGASHKPIAANPNTKPKKRRTSVSEINGLSSLLAGKRWAGVVIVKFEISVMGFSLNFNYSPSLSLFNVLEIRRVFDSFMPPHCAPLRDPSKPAIKPKFSAGRFYCAVSRDRGAESLTAWSLKCADT